jgi:hypothetical protein
MATDAVIRRVRGGVTAGDRLPARAARRQSARRRVDRCGVTGGHRRGPWPCTRVARSDVVVHDFERRLVERSTPHSIVDAVAGCEHDVAAHLVAVETEVQQGVLGQGLRLLRRGLGDVAAPSSGEQRTPLAVGQADDLVVGALAADVLVGGDRRELREYRPASAEGRASPVPSSLLMTMPATPTLPPRRRKYSTAEQTLLAT